MLRLDTMWPEGSPGDTLKRAPAKPMGTEYFRARWQHAQREDLVDRLLCEQIGGGGLLSIVATLCHRHES